jgi:hypothetical protein
MYSYEIENDRVLMTFEGDLDGRQLRASYEEVLNGPTFQSGSQILVNDRATSFDPTVDEAQRLVEYFASLGDAVSHFAIVVGKDVHFGIGRMVEVYCESRGVSLRIFRDLDEARGWLDDARGWLSLRREPVAIGRGMKCKYDLQFMP